MGQPEQPGESQHPRFGRQREKTHKQREMETRSAKDFASVGDQCPAQVSRIRTRVHLVTWKGAVASSEWKNNIIALSRFRFFRDIGIQVRDFGESWRDGNAFLAIIDAIRANLVNIAAMREASNRARLTTAFQVAEVELGIARLLDPEDVDVPQPDEKSIMTYVAQFLHKYPEPGSTASDSFAAVQQEYDGLFNWLSERVRNLEQLDRTNSFPPNYGVGSGCENLDRDNSFFLELVISGVPCRKDGSRSAASGVQQVATSRRDAQHDQHHQRLLETHTEPLGNVRDSRKSKDFPIVTRP